jgi:putative membrane protein
MRWIDVLAIASVTAVTIACDRNKTNDTARADSAVGTTGTADPAERNKVSRTDKNFVHDLAIANIGEIELAKLAPERSTDSEVKKFAQLMIDDHTKSLNSLKAIAAEYSVAVPSELEGRHARLRERIAKWHGNEFERAYMDAAVDGHEDTLQMLEPRVDEANLAAYKTEIAHRIAGRRAVEQGVVVAIIPEKSDNPLTMKLNEWAATAYPIVRAHLDAARLLKIAVDKRPRTTN